MRRFLILQARPEDDAAENEFAAILHHAGLSEAQVARVRMERDPLPEDPGAFAGIVMGGGPACVSDPPQAKSATDARIEAAALAVLVRVCAHDLPFLGCCYGIGVLAHYLGGEVSGARWSEPVGPADCTLTEAGRADPLLAGFPERFTAFVGHKEAVQALPQGCVHLVAGAACPFQMIRYRRNVYATQFHPEADAAGFALRIRVYRDKGYFPPDQADALIATCDAADVPWPPRLLGAFTARYG